MGDQGKWFKLWCSSRDDSHLENLELDDFGRWCKLGTYIKEHGRDGKVRFDPPYRSLLNLFRLTEIAAAVDVLQRFPNCVVGERSSTVSSVTNSNVSLEIEFTNWLKYQGDFSGDRVRKFRDKKRHHVTLQEEKRREVEEKRREEKYIPTKIGAFTKPSALEVTAYAKGIGFELDGQRFIDHYEANGWKVGRNPMRSWQAAIRTWKNRNPGGSIAPNGRTSGISYTALARAKRADAEGRTITRPREMSARLGSLPDVPVKAHAD